MSWRIVSEHSSFVWIIADVFKIRFELHDLSTVCHCEPLTSHSTSFINSNFFRPTIDSMQQWADTVNDSSYTFEETLPYYKKSIHFTPPNDKLRASNATAKYDADAFESNGGPLQVSYANYAQPFSSWMNKGMEAIGIKEAQDFNLGSLMGGQYCSSTIDPASEIRSSSEESFLSKITPASLTTYSQTLAKKIVFNKNKKATGIQVKGLLGNTVTLSATKEVIISAGAFQSPQLLMVSGVGPTDILNEHEIDIVAELPGVGQNMWDHPFFAPSYRVQVSTLTQFANDLMYAAGKVVSGILMKTGPITNPVSDYLAWEKIPQSLRSAFSKTTQKALSQFPNDWPEAEVRTASHWRRTNAATNTNNTIVHLWSRLHGQYLQSP